MEDLNKTQIILLGLLVSFISSLATSIMTYSLLSEAPTTITQTINRVVERTIETVVPVESKPQIVTKEVTVVVKEEDLVIDSIKKNEKSLVRIQETVPGSDPVFVSFGLILNKTGLIATSEIEFNASSKLEAVLSDNSRINLQKISTSTLNFSFFKIVSSETKDFSAPVLGDSNNLQLGQTIISIKGKERNTVSIGRISELADIRANIGNATSSKYSLIESDAGSGEVGGPALNLNGDLIGLSLGESKGFIPINILKREMEGLF